MPKIDALKAELTLDRQIAIFSLIIAIVACLWVLFSQFKVPEINLAGGATIVIFGLIARSKFKHHRKLLSIAP